MVREAQVAPEAQAVREAQVVQQELARLVVRARPVARFGQAPELPPS